MKYLSGRSVALVIVLMSLLSLRPEAVKAAGGIAPRTVVLMVETTDGRGGVGRSTYTEALEADGSLALVYDSLDAATGRVMVRQRKILTSDRMKVEVIDKLAEKNTRRVKDEDYVAYHLGAMRSPAAMCLQNPDESYAGTETLQGFEAVRVERRNPEVVSWFAVKHGCALIGEEVTLRDANGAAQGKSVKRLVYLSDAEPAEIYFRVPTTYTEVPLAALFRQRP